MIYHVRPASRLDMFFFSRNGFGTTPDKEIDETEEEEEEEEESTYV